MIDLIEGLLVVILTDVPACFLFAAVLVGMYRILR